MTTDRYLDPLTESADPDTRRFIDELEDALAPAPLPAHVRASVALALSPQRASATRSPTSMRRSRRRPIIAVVALLAALVGVIGAAGADPPTPTALVNQAMVYAPGEQQVMQRYGHGVTASAHACGYTLQVRRVYADANRLSVLYTITGPAGRHFLSVMDMWPTLTDARHSFLRNLDFGMSRDTAGGMEGRYAAYDVSRISWRAATLRVRLTIPSLTMVEAVKPLSLGAATASCETYQDGGDYVLGPSAPLIGGIPVLAEWFPSLSNTYHYRVVTVHRPMTVTLTVPVDPRRLVLTPHRTIVAEGAALTLARVVITRSETRVYLQRTTPGHILEGVRLTMLVGGRQYGDGIPLFGDWWQNRAPATRLYDFWFEGPSLAHHGAWQLDVQSDVSFRNSPRGFPGGPWIFRFHVP